MHVWLAFFFFFLIELPSRKDMKITSSSREINAALTKMAQQQQPQAQQQQHPPITDLDPIAKFKVLVPIMKKSLSVSLYFYMIVFHVIQYSLV